MNDSAPVKSALRVLDLMEYLAVAQDAVGVSEIARQLAIPKSSAFMLLATLEARGYVIGNSERRFRLNPVFAKGGSWVGGSHAALIRLARSVMDVLARSTAESSFLGVRRDESTAEYIAKSVSVNEVRCDAELHHARPLHSTSVGLVLLAFEPAETSERFLSRAKLERVTAKTLTDGRQVKRELEAIRERGYAIARDTNSAGASGIAAPVFGSSERLIAALNVSAPTSRFDAMLKQRGIDALLRSARSLSRDLQAGSAKDLTEEVRHE